MTPTTTTGLTAIDGRICTKPMDAMQAVVLYGITWPVLTAVHLVRAENRVLHGYDP